MYLNRIQIHHYGPIEKLDISLPISGGVPQPVLLVGQNGAGKTILLSHIVNALLSAKAIAYPNTPEVEEDKVYKVRSSLYITLGSQYYFSRVDFENGHSVSELHLKSRRDNYEDMPTGINESSAKELWEKIKSHENDVQGISFYLSEEQQENVKDSIKRQCVLYFPSDRFEEPAWLNKKHLLDPPSRINVPYTRDTPRDRS